MGVSISRLSTGGTITGLNWARLPNPRIRAARSGGADYFGQAHGTCTIPASVTISPGTAVYVKLLGSTLSGKEVDVVRSVSAVTLP